MHIMIRIDRMSLLIKLHFSFVLLARVRRIRIVENVKKHKRPQQKSHGTTLISDRTIGSNAKASLMRNNM